MSAALRTNLVALGSGALFAVGLGLSGMTRTDKVQGFLDVAGAWDPALLFVMGGAIAVHAFALWVLAPRLAPDSATSPPIPRGSVPPPSRSVDARLVLGAAVFGVGWGLGGFCPGPGVVSVVTGSAAPLAFSAAFVLGSVLAAALVPARAADRSLSTPPAPDASPAA